MKPGSPADGKQIRPISSRQLALLLIVPVIVIAGAVYLTSQVQRNAAVVGSERQVASQQLLTAMLDQETGARGYFQTRQRKFLEPWRRGTTAFGTAVARLQDLVRGDSDLRQRLADQTSRGLTWHAMTKREIRRLERTGRTQSRAEALRNKGVLDDFRVDHTAFDESLSAQRDQEQSTATSITVGVTAALAVLLAAMGLVVARRMAHRELVRQHEQSELRELLQASESEGESRVLLIRHVERLLPRVRAAVFNRNNSDDRLELTYADSNGATELDSIDPEALRPRSCMAVRLSRPYEDGATHDRLSSCEICGKMEGEIACEPLLVGGQVIGSVLVVSKGSIDGRDRSRIRESVSQAAPILSNQRTLALAEMRAASDALTGLPNRRSADDTLKRMAVHAGRSVTPLAAVLADLDHFKRLNDQHGHETGDKALALVGRIISSSLRGSDFAARFGGEEFLLLLPDTDREGAMNVAEKLRHEIEQAEIPNGSQITASFGVAVLPNDAVDSSDLLRKADRALYSAKEHGRNRVHAFTSATEALPTA